MRTRFVFLAVAAACSAFAAGPAKEWTRQWPVSASPELRVEADDARLIVTGADIRQVEARVTVTGWEIGPGGVQITERQTANRVELEVRIPRSSRWMSIGDRSIRVELRVPSQLTATLRTGDGSITLEGVRGAIRLNTGDGSIQASGIEGSLVASTGDGSIRARGRFEVLTLGTGDGSVEAEVLSGSRMTSAWDIHTGDGHVTLRLPSDFAAEIDAHSNDGRVDADFPVLIPGGNRSDGLRGKINGGGPLLKIRTGDGRIRLARL
jgi:hypothetical protein